MQRQRKAARRHRRTAMDREGAPTLFTVFKRVLPALPITVAVGLLLLFVTAALLLLTKDPGRYYTPIALAVLYLTALVGGFIATRLARRRLPLLCGITEGAFLLIFCTVTGLFMPEAWHGGISGGIAALTRLLLLPVAVLGALVGAREKNRRYR